MLQRSLNALGRFAGSIVAFGLLAVAVPALLLTIARRRFDSANPLHEVQLPWQWDLDAILESLRNPLTNDVVVNLLIRSSLVVAWVAVAVIVATTVVETTHLVRHRGLAMPRVRGIGWAQPMARFIAAGLIVFLPLATPKSSLVSAHPATPSPSTSATSFIESHDSTSDRAVPTTARSVGTPEQPSAVESGSAVSAPRSAGLHVVQQGESVYGIAETLAADVSMSTAEVANAILDANIGSTMSGGARFTNPAYIEVDWELVIPGHVLPRATSSPPTPNTEQPDVDSAESGNSHIVIEGDTLSQIAEQHLGDADAWPSIFEANRDEQMGDGRTFDDPNLIVPGWDLAVPSDVNTNDADSTGSGEESPGDSEVTEVGQVTEDAEVTIGTAEVDDLATPATSSPSVPATESTDPPAPTTESPSDVEQPTSSTVPSSTPSTFPSSTTSTTVPVAPGAGDGSKVESSPQAPSPIQIEHAALLATGVLAMVGVRRRLRLRSAAPRARVPDPPASVVATERRLRSIDPGERATRIDVAIRAAAKSLVDTDAQIGALFVDQDGAVDVRLTTAADLPAPWESAADDGQSWLLPASIPVELLSAEARLVGTPCVALVQLGVADGRDVLVDMEACGSFAVEALPDQADSIVTAIAAGLASSPYAEVAHLISVSLPHTALLDHRNAHHAASISTAFDLAASLVGSTMSNERTSFSLRSLRTGGEMWEPALLLLGSADRGELPAVAAAFPEGGHGVGVVASVAPDTNVDARARLTGTADAWTLDAFGLSLPIEPVGISADELRDVTDLLDDAVESLIESAESTTDETSSEATGQSLADAMPDREPFEPRDHSIVVRLMGGVDVIDVDGNAGKFERSKTVELVAWLATHREKSTRNAARTALWDLDVRDATFANVVSEARRALGRLVRPEDDEEWLARTLTEQLPLHSAVVTDADLIEERLEAAQLQSPAHAVETLRPAAAMIRDMPFAGTSYLWPDAEGITSNLVLLATGVATELAGHALSLGDTDLVFWATGQGLTVLPGHEELIGLRMRAHARAGDLAGIRQEWESYERVIVADAWSDGEPAPKLLALRRELLTTPA